MPVQAAIKCGMELLVCSIVLRSRGDEPGHVRILANDVDERHVDVRSRVFAQDRKALGAVKGHSLLLRFIPVRGL
jgi:hypothetical protein